MNTPQPTCISCRHMDHIGICSENSCSCINYPSRTEKEYSLPNSSLLQIKLEKQIAESAIKWLNLEHAYYNYLKSIKFYNNDTEKEMIEFLGKQVVLLLKKE